MGSGVSGRSRKETERSSDGQRVMGGRKGKEVLVMASTYISAAATDKAASAAE